MLDDLQVMIKKHHELLIKEFSVPLTPKDHIITHYPAIIEKIDPPRTYWTMRFEGKNGYFKDLAHKLKNFKDIAFTLSLRHQKYIISEWKNKYNFLEKQPILQNFKKNRLKSTNYAAIIAKHFNITLETFIYVGKSVQFRGTNLRLNKFICTSFSEKFPNFDKTKLFFSVNSTIFVLYESWSTIDISPLNLGYIIKNNSSLFIMEMVNFLFTKAWEMYTTSKNYIVIITEYFL